MIKKIGISNCNENDSCIFSYKEYKEILKLNEKLPVIDRIHNIIINNEIISQRVIGENIILVISLEIKVIYTSLLGNGLYVFKDNIIASQRIKIPSDISLQGISAIKSRAIKAKVYIVDINGKIQRNKTLSLGFFIFCEFGAIEARDLKIIFSLHNLNPNLYFWSIEKGELTQKTFFINQNIIFSSCNKEILLIVENLNERFIYKVINGNLEKIHYPFNIQDPIFIENGPLGTYFIIWKDRNKVCLSLILDSLEIKRYEDIELYENSKVIYNSKINSLLYLERKEEKDTLTYSNVILDEWEDEKYSLVNEIEIYDENISSYYLSEAGNYIGYVLNKEKIILCSIEERIKEELYIPLYSYKVKSIRFSKNEEQLFILLKKNNCDQIYAYNIKSKVLKAITENTQGTNISDFYIDDLSSFIYISDNSTGEYNIYKISLNNLEIKDILPLEAKDIKIL